MKKYQARYLYLTMEINNLVYISGYQLSEDGIYSHPPIEPLADENGKLRWVIDRDDPTNIYEARQPLTIEEESIKKDREKRKQIRILYSPYDEIKLLNAAILSLSDGKPLPQEYLDYRKAVDDILAKKLSMEADNGRR